MNLQGFSQKTDVINQRILGVKEYYSQADVANVLSGKTYNLKYRFAINSQFYKDTNPEQGTLLFDGVFFPSIEIQYDLYIQKVVILNETKNTSRYIIIDTDKVSKFSIAESNFVRIFEDSIMEQGIYELAFVGKESDVLIKRQKNRKEKVVDGKNVLFFSEENEYYVKNKFGTFLITNKKALFRAYQNEIKIKVLVKENKIKLSKKGLEAGLIKAASLYDLK